MHFDQAPAFPDPKSEVTASVSSSEPRDHSQADHQWEEASQRLNAASLTGTADTLINDILQSEDFVIDGASEAQGKFFNQALVITASDLTKRDVAFALAICVADSGVANATASLLAEYNTSRLHAFLGPEMLHALSLLAERDAYARRETVGVLLQITPLETRYLLIRAAKIAGRLESIATTPLLRGKLEEWTESDDPAVSGEAFFQLALLSLGDALCAQDVASLTVRLADSRVAFARAEQSEECRVDARLYLALVDLLLSFHETDGTRDRHEIISARARQLIALIDNPRMRPWHGYASKAEELAQYRLLTITRCFEAISAAASEMEKWTNFDASLSEVAALYAMLLHGDREETLTLGGATLSRVAEVAVAPPLGPLLDRVVTRQRLAKVIENLETANDKSELVNALRSLQDAAYVFEYQRTEATLPSNTMSLLEEAVKDPQALRFFYPVCHPMPDQFSQKYQQV